MLKSHLALDSIGPVVTLEARRLTRMNQSIKVERESYKKCYGALVKFSEDHCTVEVPSELGSTCIYRYRSILDSPR